MANVEHGMIAVDKMGTKVLFLNPPTYATEVVIDGFRQDRARIADRAGDRPSPLGLCADLRRRHPRPQSASAASPLRVRSAPARARRHHRSVALYRPAYAQARARRLDLHHLRELGEGRGDRPRDQQSGRRDRFRLDQRPSPDHRAGRRSASTPRTRRTPRSRSSTCRSANCSARSRRRGRSPASPSRPTAAPWSRSTTRSRRCS